MGVGVVSPGGRSFWRLLGHKLFRWMPVKRAIRDCVDGGGWPRRGIGPRRGWGSCGGGDGLRFGGGVGAEVADDAGGGPGGGVGVEEFEDGEVHVSAVGVFVLHDVDGLLF